MKKRLSILLLSTLTLALIGCGAKVTGIVEQSQVLQTPTHQNQGNSYKKIFKDSVFLGDSITEGLVSFGVLNEENVIGLTGQTAEFSLENVDEITSRKPTDIFILLGQCDLLWPVDNPIDHAVKQYATLIDELQKKSPETQIHIQTITPVTEEALKREPRYEEIALLNTLLEELAKEKAVNFIDLSPIFESNNDLYSADGIHFKEDFYKLWVEYVSSEIQ